MPDIVNNYRSVLFLPVASKIFEKAKYSHHEQKNKTTSQIKFSTVKIKQQIKLVLQHSLCKCIGSNVATVSSEVFPV